VAGGEDREHEQRPRVGLPVLQHRTRRGIDADGVDPRRQGQVRTARRERRHRARRHGHESDGGHRDGEGGASAPASRPPGHPTDAE
jgi:hypothetical protein